MKKLLIILLLLPFAVSAQTTYQLNYDSIRVNKTAGTGGTSLYGKVYLKNVSAGLSADSVLSVRNGRIFKIATVSPDSTIFQTVANFFPKGDTRYAKIGDIPTLGALAISLGGTANGLSYSAGNYRLHKVTATTGGVLTTGSDTISGAKTFTSAIIGTTGNFSASATNPLATTNTGGREWLNVNTTLDGGFGTFRSSGTVRGYIGNGNGLFGATESDFGLRSEAAFKIQTGGNNTRYTIDASGGHTFASLAGAGSRMVVADANGLLGTQAIPGGGGGSVTGIAVATANGLAGTSDGAAVVPTITLSTSITGIIKGNGTALSAATAGTDYMTPANVSAAYLPLSGGTLTGALIGTTGNFNASATNPLATTNTGGREWYNVNTTLDGGFGTYRSSGTIRGYIGNGNGIFGATESDFGLRSEGALKFSTNGGNVRYTIDASGNNVWTGTVAASNLSGTNTGDNAANTTSNTYADGKVADNLTASTTVAPSKTAVNTALSLKAPLASPALTGNPTAPTQSAADNSTKIATTAYVDNAGTFKANLNSPSLTGTPTAPTAGAGTNNTQIATTAYVDRLGGGTITSGRYDGVITGGTNVGGTSYTVNGAHYKRIGNEVTVTGRCNLSTVGAGASVFFIALPIASNLAVGVDLLGNATADANSSNLIIYGDTGGDRALVEFTAAAAANMEVYYNFTYTIL